MWLFLQPQLAVGRAMGRAYNTYLMQFLDSFSYFLTPPKQFIYFDSYHSSCGLTGSQLVFPLSTGLITLTKRWTSLIEVCIVPPCRILMPNMFSAIGEKKHSYSQEGGCHVLEYIWSQCQLKAITFCLFLGAQ